MRSLAAEGRTVLVSSHLISEMALTADHLLVIGGGRLLADDTVESSAAAAPRWRRRTAPAPGAVRTAAAVPMRAAARRVDQAVVGALDLARARLCARVRLGLGLADTVSTVTLGHHDGSGPGRVRPVGGSFTGLVFAQLAFGVLGVLAVTAEYSTGMISPR